MKNIIKSVIERGGYDLSDLLKKIDYHHICGKLSDTERDELYEMARNKANAANGVDVMGKLLELEDRIRKLENKDSEETPSDTYTEYVAGKWYYAGDKISYGGKNYTCSAPDGVVCTWNPDEYPAYWNIEE